MKSTAQEITDKNGVPRCQRNLQAEILDIPCLLVMAGIILVPLGHSSVHIWGHRDWKHQIIQTQNIQPIPKDG